MNRFGIALKETIKDGFSRGHSLIPYLSHQQAVQASIGLPANMVW